jgi:hypothetical protein
VRARLVLVFAFLAASAWPVCFAGHVLAAELVFLFEYPEHVFSACENSQIGLFLSMYVWVLLL